MKPKIVVYMADDDADDRFFVRQSFQKINPSAQIIEAEDGVELLALLDIWSHQVTRPPIHLILLDMNMPRMNGLETLRRIKSNPLLRHIPTVILSTSAESTSVEKAYLSGTNGYIQKSSATISTDQIIQAVNVCYLDAVSY